MSSVDDRFAFFDRFLIIRKVNIVDQRNSCQTGWDYHDRDHDGFVDSYRLIRSVNEKIIKSDGDSFIIKTITRNLMLGCVPTSKDEIIE